MTCPKRGGADCGRVGSLSLQSCGVDFEVKAYAIDSSASEEDRIPKK